MLDAAVYFEPVKPIRDMDTPCFVISKYLNIYGYPKELELDYKDIFDLPDNYVRVDGYIREVPETLQLPETVTRGLGEKLVYIHGLFWLH